jgi:hypothetical protein
LVYIDDIVVFGNSFEELKSRLREVFARLQDANLKRKATKVKLFQERISFLGHIVSGNGVAVDDKKIQDIVAWPQPKNVHEIRQFLGLCGYYRRYIEKYSEHASSLHALTKKGEPYTWNSERQGAFEYLKTKLTSAPILAMSRDDGEYVLDVDASDCAMGAVLQQYQDGNLRVIAYASRTFNECERRYCITRKELAAMVFGLKQFRQYLLGRSFTVRTDHSALLYLRTAKELIGQQARWLDFIEEFTFKLQHRAGTAHGNADALSRRDMCAVAGICNQCRKRGLLPRDPYAISDATCARITCRDPAVSCGTSPSLHDKQDDFSSAQVCVVTTRGQKKRQELVTLTIGQDDEVGHNDVSAPAEDIIDSTLFEENIRTDAEKAVEVKVDGRKKRRNQKRATNINQRLELWTTEFLIDEQTKDSDLQLLREWITTSTKPTWDDVRGHSPALKAYWHQFETFVSIDGSFIRAMVRETNWCYQRGCGSVS